ncbi:unnamed protein product [Cyprideis torosa]|uniref:Uncharacterized protein n=1 Tax=Cyprideis torosa TaxID=163714 RepID=A0A7R8W579_9CRUS|nr:unnamed protein product [Cyprideis torosa]CAG0882604.1 unnamed protein product [Cyprideis torosa]
MHSDLLDRVERFRRDLKKVESEAQSNENEAKVIERVIQELETSIGVYKDEYAVLIAETNRIKQELATVQAKVDRSMALLRSLSQEKERWQTTHDAFQAQMGTIVGDVLLSAAFLAYAGYFDQSFRSTLFSAWCSHLSAAGVQYRMELARTEYLSNPDYRMELARTEYLSNPDVRLRWTANLLPSDDLCVENAIMLSRFNRYPLVIDPSGQATQFIMNEFADKKISRTSFLDEAFRKNLESALRFGNPLLVEDVENYDPILNPVLNREVRRTGGRVLMTLGDQDIDLSPSFMIILTTRDPTVEFPPNLCSRVTFVKKWQWARREVRVTELVQDVHCRCHSGFASGGVPPPQQSRPDQREVREGLLVSNFLPPPPVSPAVFNFLKKLFLDVEPLIPPLGERTRLQPDTPPRGEAQEPPITKRWPPEGYLQRGVAASRPPPRARRRPPPSASPSRLPHRC